MSKASAQAALFARFGVPVKVAPDAVDDGGTEVVRVYSVGSREAAAAFVGAERELWGNPARFEDRPGVGWVVIVDLRAVVAEHKATTAYRRSLWSR